MKRRSKTEKRKPHKPHWYFCSEEYCVLCGRTQIFRERRYGRRPQKWWDRHELIETACGEHWLDGA